MRTAVSENGVDHRQKCKSAKGAVLDDVVSPLVSRHVAVIGHWTPKRRDFVIRDIYEDGEGVVAPSSNSDSDSVQIAITQQHLVE